LSKTEWEIKIVDHFINSNTDPKTFEQLRLIDIENLEKYLPNIKDPKKKSEIQVELLRTASQDTRVNFFKIYFFSNLDL